MTEPRSQICGMRKILASVAALALCGQAAASTWCPLPASAKAWKIPPGSFVELGKRELTLHAANEPVKPCASDGSVYEFSCAAYALALPCSTAKCNVAIDFAPIGSGRGDSIALQNDDITAIDLTKVELRLQPEYDARWQTFQLCQPGQEKAQLAD